MAERPVDTVRLQELAQAYGQSAALTAAVELGLFAAVSAGAGTAAELAAALAIHPVNAERLATMLTAMGLLERDGGGRWRNAADAERFLVPGRPGYAGAWMLFTRSEWEDWGRLADHLRAPDLRLLGEVGDFTEAEARRYHEATFSIGMGAARRFCRQVDLAGRRRLMDIGGGSGCYCIVAARTWPQLGAVVLDLPPVVAVTRQFVAEYGVAERVAVEACDFTRDPFPRDCDVALMASNLPMYGPDVIAAVIAKAHEALLPGGEMHLIGEALDDDRRGPVGPAFWALREAVQRSRGVAHSIADCLGYFRSAGFGEVAAAPFVAGSLVRISGRKAG